MGCYASLAGGTMPRSASDRDVTGCLVQELQFQVELSARRRANLKLPDLKLADLKRVTPGNERNPR